MTEFGQGGILRQPFRTGSLKTNLLQMEKGEREKVGKGSLYFCLIFRVNVPKDHDTPQMASAAVLPGCQPLLAEKCVYMWISLGRLFLAVEVSQRAVE